MKKGGEEDMKWFIKCLKNYATFRERARRKEYWMFVLVFTIILFVLGLLLSLANPETFYDTNSMNTDEPDLIESLLSMLFSLFFLLMILPSIAVAVRRLHDTGRSGWWYFINFIPFIGPIILTIFLIFDSEPNENKYGANPKVN